MQIPTACYCIFLFDRHTIAHAVSSPVPPIRPPSDPLNNPQRPNHSLQLRKALRNNPLDLYVITPIGVSTPHRIYAYSLRPTQTDILKVTEIVWNARIVAVSHVYEWSPSYRHQNIIAIRKARHQADLLS